MYFYEEKKYFKYHKVPQSTTKMHQKILASCLQMDN